MRFKKGFIYLELGGQGGGIIMGVTRLLLLGLLHHTDQNGPKHFDGECILCIAGSYAAPCTEWRERKRIVT